MKNRILLILLMSVLVLVSGCSGSEKAIQATDVYTKSVAAMEAANAYAFEMEMNQVTHFSALEELFPDGMETRATAHGKAIQTPLAMEMTANMEMPEVGNMVMTVYLVDGRMYMSNSMEEGWISLDMSELFDGMEEIAAMNQVGDDPLQLFKMLGEDGAAEATMETDGNQYVLTLNDPDGSAAMRMLGDVIKNDLDGAMGVLGTDMEQLMAGINMENLFYRLRVEKDTFYPTEIETSYKMSMEIEGGTMSMENYTRMQLKDFGSFGVITVPDEIKNSAIDFGEFLKSMMNSIQ